MRGPIGSGVRFRALPCVMLVGLKGDLAQLLPNLPVEVLVVRHATAAYERMQVRRPLAVFVGDGLCAHDFALVCKAADEIRAELIRIPHAIEVAEFRDWLEAALFARGPKTQRPAAGDA